MLNKIKNFFSKLCGCKKHETKQINDVDEASEESFPSSDPPAWNTTHKHKNKPSSKH